jgi:nucleoside-diphosphate-sugar epimerase
MLILMTGSSGFIGRGLTQVARENGIEIEPLLNNLGHKWRFGDEVNQKQLSRAGVIIHAGWDFKIQGSESNNKINLEGSENLIRLCQSHKTNHKLKFLFISSMSAFRDCASVYGQTKLAVESIVIQNGGIVIRPGFIWSRLDKSDIMRGLERDVSSSPVVFYISMIKSPQYLANREELAKNIFELISKFNENKGRIFTVAFNKPYSHGDIYRAIASHQNQKRYFLGIPGFLLRVVFQFLDLFGKSPVPLDQLDSLLFADPNPSINCPTSEDFAK